MPKRRVKVGGLILEVGRAKVFKWVCPKCGFTITRMHPNQVVAAARSHMLTHIYKKKKK